MIKRYRNRRTTLAALATVGALGAGFLGATPAHAADPIPPVNPSGTGAIVVTKLENPGGTIPQGYGEENASPGGTPLPGALYKVCKVSGNGTVTLSGTPTSYGWWEGAAQIAAAYPGTAVVTSGDTSTNCTTGLTTNGSGQAVFSGLGLGLYLVTEVSAPGGYTPASPFLVTMPLLSNTSNVWLTPANAGSNALGISDTYVAYAYPKNPENSVEKTANQTNTLSVGSAVPYSITSTVPCRFSDNGTPSITTDDTCNLTQLTIRDKIDTTNAVLDFDPASLVITAGGTTFIVGTDYTVTSAPTQTTPTWVGSNFEIVFTGAGITKLDGIAAASTSLIQLEVKYNFIVGALNTQATAGINGSTIDNDVHLWWNEPTSEPGVGDDTDVYFGGVMIHKTDAKSGAVIPGAEFKIFATEAAANAWTEATCVGGTWTDPDHSVAANCDGGTYGGNDAGFLTATTISGTTASRFTTNSAGQAGILGLSYDPKSPNCYMSIDGDQSSFGSTLPTWADDGLGNLDDTVAQAGRTYWIVETVVPNGYVGTAVTPVCVTGALDGDTWPSHSYDDFMVTNTPRNAGFPLPFTGDGQANYPVILGLLVVLVGAGAYVYRTKKTQAIA